MPITLTGREALKARVDAVKAAFRPIGAQWAQDTAAIARANYPVRTGKTAASIRVRSTGKTRATVKAAFPARVVEGDTKAHTIMAKGSALAFSDGGRTIFRKKVFRRARRGTPVLVPAGELALQRNPVSEGIVKAWNDAA